MLLFSYVFSEARRGRKRGGLLNMYLFSKTFQYIPSSGEYHLTLGINIISMVQLNCKAPVNSSAIYY